MRTLPIHLGRIWRGVRRRRRERIFILPTAFGAVYLGGAAVMIMVGAAYGNNLVNLLAYFLLSVIIVAMVQTHANLRDVRVVQALVEAGPAGGEVRAAALVENASARPKFSLDVRARGLAFAHADDAGGFLNGRSSLRFRATYRAGGRGRKRLTRVRVSSTYPLGLFRAWTTRDVDATYWVHPRPEGPLVRPAQVSVDSDGGGARSAALSDAQDFRGHRRLQPGDAYSRVDWKARARGRPLLVKEFDGGGGTAAVLDWDHTASLIEGERRLSQLAQWVEQARADGSTFSLKIDRLSIGPAAGTAHVRRCLEALAEHPLRRPHG